MRKTGLFIVAAIAAFMMACAAPAENKPANAPANTATKAAAPTVDSLLDMEKKAHEAYSKGDTKYFETLLSDKAVMTMGKERMGKAGIIQMIGGAKCEGVEVKLSDGQLSKIDDDTYAFTYKSDSTGKCNEGKDGAMVDLKPARNGTVWVRNGDKWQAVWHGETMIMAPPANEVKEDAKKDDKAAEPKKEDAKPVEPKKEDKPAEPKKDDKPAANAAADAKPEPAKLTPSANTEALTKAHAAGWEAFKNKDAKFFEGALASTFGFVDPMGGYTGSKADAIKEWTGGGKMKCEGITKTTFGDSFALAVSPTVEILFGKGNADGKCDGQANGDLWQTAVYIKDGDAWKLAYMLEQVPMG